jgi:putative transcriptional regulator
MTGSLLVASPALADSTFAQSVIYLCAHSAADGAMGLVVNRRLSQPGLNDVMMQLGIEPAPPRRHIGLCSGGPLEGSRGFVLHSSDWSGDGSLSVDRTITLTASLDVLREIADGAGPRHAMLALGHAAWEPGQLEEEILRHNAWYVAPASEAIVFGTDHSVKWSRALAAIDLDAARLSSTVGHA